MHLFSDSLSASKNKSPSTSPNTTINNYQLEVVDEFTYLRSTISSKLSLVNLGKCMWKNPRLTIKTKVLVYNPCILNVFLCGSEFCTTYNAQKRRLNVFHRSSLRKLIGISWMSRTPQTFVLSRCGLPTMFTMLRQRRLRWLGHVRRMKDGRIPKDILYGELIVGKRNLERPQLYYRVVCKRYNLLTYQLVPSKAL